MENKRRKKYEDIECVPIGYANGVAPGYPLTEDEKWKMVEEAAEAYGKFLDALKVDWRNDPNSAETPKRVAKAYIFDLFKGRYDKFTEITSFPSDGYDGVIIGYVAGVEGRVIGLSKLNRIVEHFGRRGAIQEQLTVAIHQAVDKVCEYNKGVIVSVVATHNCVSCRGIGHQGASMVTTKASGVFLDNHNQARQEFFDSIKVNTNI